MSYSPNVYYHFLFTTQFLILLVIFNYYYIMNIFARSKRLKFQYKVPHKFLLVEIKRKVKSKSEIFFNKRLK